MAKVGIIMGSDSDLPVMQEAARMLEHFGISEQKMGVPVKSKALNGMDSLLSIVQMPAGIPVASVAIGKAGAKNAAYLATQILATGNPELGQKLLEERAANAEAIRAKDNALQESLKG